MKEQLEIPDPDLQRHDAAVPVQLDQTQRITIKRQRTIEACDRHYRSLQVDDAHGLTLPTATA